MLGTSSPYPRPDDPCSSLLIETGATSLWVDAGAGTLAALLARRPLEELDAVWISQTHADHFSDLDVTAHAVDHDVPAFGFRAEHGGSVVAYTGDSGPCEALRELATVRGARRRPGATIPVGAPTLR